MTQKRFNHPCKKPWAKSLSCDRNRRWAVYGIGIHLLDDVRRRLEEIGYWLYESYWGNGIVTNAVSSLIPVAFERFDIVRLQAWDFF
ncbi:MAG: GNAT family N-acetyltransferase [Methanomicrobiales archaeon]|nr:GNAT family N-acetyltransferase [Methanomicrobiales archaeon]